MKPPVKLITPEEYLMGRAKIEDLTPEQRANMDKLLAAVNELIKRYGRSLPINSGFRSKEDQMRINPKSMSSKHLICAAIDLGDKDHSFRHWLLTHLEHAQELKLWIEDPSHTSTWIHLQCIPPKSGYRIFIP